MARPIKNVFTASASLGCLSASGEAFGGAIYFVNTFQGNRIMLKAQHLTESDSHCDDLPPGDEPSTEQAVQQVAEALRAGHPPEDDDFDRFLSQELRSVSAQHWTPLVVAARAAAWFDALNVRTVTDIGSGAGKFCVAAALTGRSHFTGLEQRPRLVAAARALARLFQVDKQVCFIEGTLGRVATPVAEAYYLYNPFGENLLLPSEQLDKGVELSTQRYMRDIAAMEELLQQAPLGTYVLTYNGFGGRVPASYDEVCIARDLPNLLRLCRKVRHKQKSSDSARISRLAETLSLT